MQKHITINKWNWPLLNCSFPFDSSCVCKQPLPPPIQTMYKESFLIAYPFLHHFELLRLVCSVNLIWLAQYNLEIAKRLKISAFICLTYASLFWHATVRVPFYLHVWPYHGQSTQTISYFWSQKLKMSYLVPMLQTNFLPSLKSTDQLFQKVNKS